MERNYQKEAILANKKNAELQELVFAYQAMYDDAVQKLKQYEGKQTEPAIEQSHDLSRIHVVEAEEATQDDE